jgi:uncharacterized RDD family membrane protein YckC
VNCPSCRRGLPAGPHDRCPFCGSRLSGPVEGALAAEPAPTPDPRDPLSPIREIPGLRKRERERTWKDEVRDRVRDRRERRSSDLPLFAAQEAALEEEEAAAPPADAAAPDPLPVRHADSEPFGRPESDQPDDILLGPAPEDDMPGPRELGEPENADLPLHPAAIDAEPPYLPAAGDPPPEMADLPPVERPALPIERLVAGVIDLAILGGIAAAVVYFSSRIARVPLAGLWPAWPWLALYLGALGLLYAGYFTGTTGQTLGKMAQRLHVLHLSGGPPGHARAVVRALLGSLGVLLAGGGLVPMLFDPARRAFHDRLLRTRVVRL